MCVFIMVSGIGMIKRYCVAFCVFMWGGEIVRMAELIVECCIEYGKVGKDNIQLYCVNQSAFMIIMLIFCTTTLVIVINKLFSMPKYKYR